MPSLNRLNSRKLQIRPLSSSPTSKQRFRKQPLHSSRTPNAKSPHNRHRYTTNRPLSANNANANNTKGSTFFQWGVDTPGGTRKLTYYQHFAKQQFGHRSHTKRLRRVTYDRQRHFIAPLSPVQAYHKRVNDFKNQMDFVDLMNSKKRENKYFKKRMKLLQNAQSDESKQKFAKFVIDHSQDKAMDYRTTGTDNLAFIQANKRKEMTNLKDNIIRKMNALHHKDGGTGGGHTNRSGNSTSRSLENFNRVKETKIKHRKYVPWDLKLEAPPQFSMTSFVDKMSPLQRRKLYRSATNSTTFDVGCAEYDITSPSNLVYTGNRREALARSGEYLALRDTEAAKGQYRGFAPVSPIALQRQQL